MHMDSTTKHEALEKCKELINGRVVKATPADQLTRTAVLSKMFIYFKNGLHNSRPAQEYLKSRGLDVTKIEVGYNAGQFHHGTRKEEALIKSCIEVGLLSEHDRLSRTGEMSYKPFAKGCIVFALRNKINQVSGLYFRSTMNNEDSRHFYLKESEGLYPFYPKAETERLIICDSVIDAASLLQIKAVTEQYSLLGAYGTNRLNPEMKAAIADLKQLKEIVFAFDSDDAGNKAAVKYAEELKQLLPGIAVTKMILPCKDVNETLTAHNEEVFTVCLSERTTDFLSLAPLAGGEPQEGKLFLSTEKPIETEALQAPLKNHNDSEQRKEPETSFPLDVSNPYKIIYTGSVANYYVQGGIPKASDHMKIMLVIENKETGIKARNRVDL